MKILAIGPHPDDAEFGCSALLIKEVKKGNQVKILVLTKGEAGTKGTPEIREQESRDAAKIIGAEIEFLDMGGDCHVQNTPANGMVIAKHIRQYKPDVLLAPQPDEDQHPDHSEAGKMARSAARFARYGGLSELKDIPTHKITALYFYAITQDFGNKPDVVVDISDVYEQWMQAVHAHKSQMQGKNYDELFGMRFKNLGVTIGVDYAQGLWANDPIRLNGVSDITLSSRNY
jgi:bacillithiol biosynthesis deacetylase BshB1